MKRIFWLVFFLAISLSMQAASWDGRSLRTERPYPAAERETGIEGFSQCLLQDEAKGIFCLRSDRLLGVLASQRKRVSEKIHTGLFNRLVLGVYGNAPYLGMGLFQKGVFHGSRRRHSSAVSQQDGFRTFKGLVLSGKERQWRGLSPWFGSKIPGGQDVSRADLSLHRGRSLVVPHDPRHGGSFAQRPHFDLGRLSSLRKGTTEQLNNLP